jgi:chromosome segregation ATPase
MQGSEDICMEDFCVQLHSIQQEYEQTSSDLARAEQIKASLESQARNLEILIRDRLQLEVQTLAEKFAYLSQMEEEISWKEEIARKDVILQREISKDLRQELEKNQNLLERQREYLISDCKKYQEEYPLLSDRKKTMLIQAAQLKSEIQQLESSSDISQLQLNLTHAKFKLQITSKSREREDASLQSSYASLSGLQEKWNPIQARVSELRQNISELRDQDLE